MAVSATINLNLSALDASSQESCDAEKKCSLSSTDSLSPAIVTIASGTCGTTAVSVDFSQYRGADGELVPYDNTWPTSTRIAFVADPSASLDWDEGSIPLRMTSRNNQVAVASLPLGDIPLSPAPLEVKTVSGILTPAYTASYTVMLLKEA